MWRVSIGSRPDGRVYINVFLGKRRYRYANGEPIGVNIQPNYAPLSERMVEAGLLRGAFEVALRRGWLPEDSSPEWQSSLGLIPKTKNTTTVLEVLQRQYELKEQMGYSYHYLRDLKRVVLKWREFAEAYGFALLYFKDLKRSFIMDFLVFASKSPRVQKNVKLNLSALLKSEFDEALLPSPFASIRLRKSQETLHRPFGDVSDVLSALKAYDAKLYLCCLMTYGLLLRPHQEIRTLTWGAFNFDLTVLSLSGAQNKSQRNRIVPIPAYVREELITIRQPDKLANIFTGQLHAYSQDYFKGLWTKFKKTTQLIERGQTIYSFRHSGAIEVFTRTNDLHLLSKLMGHSSLLVTLTYLRGLEITTFDANDLPHLEVPQKAGNITLDSYTGLPPKNGTGLKMGFG